MKKNPKSLYQQYADIKNQHMDAIVLLQVGEFYQPYYYDAVIASDLCGVKLISRPLGEKKYAASCGIPQNVIEDRVQILSNKGYKVVLCNESIDLAGDYRVRNVTSVIEPSDDKVDITITSKDYFEKYKDYTDAEIREEYKLVKKAQRKKKEVDEPVYDFTSRKYDVNNNLLKVLEEKEMHENTIQAGSNQEDI